MKKILFIITGLNTGGAEIVLLNLLKNLDKDKYQAQVISLTNEGPLTEKIRALDITVKAINLNLNFIPPLICLLRIIKEFKPDVVQTLLYHGDFIGGLISFLAGYRNIVWGIHNSTLDKQTSKITTRILRKLSAYLSSWIPKKIISCSQESIKIHLHSGYNSQKMTFIPNGIDTNIYKPNNEFRAKIRNELNLSNQVFVAGLIGRFHPQKDHMNFIEAAHKILLAKHNVYFILCGKGVDKTNQTITNKLKDLGIEDHFRLLGERSDINQIMAALDVMCLSSSAGEAFPLVLAEAMACGVPCVTTNIGDSGYLVGDSGITVNSCDPLELSKGIMHIKNMSSKDYTKLSQLSENRIKSFFSVGMMTRNYEKIYGEILDNVRN